MAKFNPLIFSGIDFAGTGGGGGPAGAVQWKAPVANESSLPTVGNLPGDARVALDTDKIYVWDSTSSKWVDSELTVAALGATPNADGLTISTTVDGDITRTTINLEPADATNPGAVSATDQSFGGIKTFTTNIVVDGDIDAKGGIESSTGTLDIGTDSVLTSTINIGHSTSDVYVNNELSLTSNKIVDVLDPTDAQDAATKAYVDSLTIGVSQVTKEPTGFPSRADSAVTFDDLSRTLTITPTSTSFDVYVKGKKFTKTEDSIVINDDSGNHYVFYDEFGSLTETSIFDVSIFTDNALVAIVYWNNETNSHIYFAEERHGLTMDGATHGYLHTVFGARYLLGLALEDFSVNGTGDVAADAQFVSDQGKIRDEDLLIEIAQQDDIPILYREGSLWRKKSADAYPVIYSGTAGYTELRLPYNRFNGTSWSLSQVNNNSFVLVHFFGTNDKDHGVVGIQGINQYSSISAARNAASTEISSLSGLPFAEFVAIGSVVFETANGYTNVPKARTRSVNGGDYVDFRGTQLYTPAGEATTHSLLSGLANDDHIQYLLVGGSRAMAGDLNLGGNDVTNASSLQLEDPGVGSNKITIKSPTLASDYTITLPADDGIDHQFIRTNGSGNLTWEFPKNNSAIYHVSSDGRSEYTTIQSAINAAESAGSSYLNPKFIIVHGQFTEDLVISKSGIYLIGETSQENLLNRINGSLTINKLVNVPGEGATSAVIYVGGLTFTETTDNFIRFTGTNPQRVKFEGCTLVSSSASVLLCDNTGVGSKVSIINCTVQTAGITKKAITMSNGWTDVRSSIIENTTSGAVVISGADSVLATITNSEINGQILSTVAASFVISISSITTTSGSAIQTTSSSYVAISNSGLSVPLSTNSITGTGSVYFADIVNGGLGGGFAPTVAALGFTNDVGNLRLPNRGTITLTESLLNGQNTTTIQAASSITSNFTLTLPGALPSNNNSAIVSSSTGALSYAYVMPAALGDIPRTSAVALDNQSSPQNITGLLFNSAITNSFDATVYVARGSTYAEYTIRGIYKAASLNWEISQDYIGDDAGIAFSITSIGQMQYTTTSSGNNAALYFRAITV